MLFRLLVSNVSKEFFICWLYKNWGESKKLMEKLVMYLLLDCFV